MKRKKCKWGRVKKSRKGKMIKFHDSFCKGEIFPLLAIFSPPFAIILLSYLLCVKIGKKSSFEGEHFLLTINIS